MKIFTILTTCAVVAAAALAYFGADITALTHVNLDIGLGTGGAALAAVVQSSYAERISSAVAGMIANENEASVDTRIVEPSSGLAFGVACSQGTNDNQVKLGGVLTAFVGVSVRDITLAPVTADSMYLDHYKQGANAGILTEGDIWVQTGGAVVVGGPVHYNATTGVFDDSGGTGPLPGARWMTHTTGVGLAILRLSGLQRT